MANCCICEKRIGGWGEDKLTIASGKDCCYQCAPLVRAVENAEDAKIFYSKLDELNKRMDDSSTNYEVRKILEDKFHEVAISNGYTRDDESSCPVCGMPLKKDETTCPKCGTIHSAKEACPDYKEIAFIYNNRFDQLKKNPMYEYRVETIADSAVLGTFDKEALQKTLREYSINGWRLHSAFTNEIGKNAALGINATINQTILIFERCIKSGEGAL